MKPRIVASGLALSVPLYFGAEPWNDEDELTVDPEDLGRVIGKRGATAQSVRTLLRALGTKNDARYNLKIVDNGVQGPKPKREDDRDSAPAEDSWSSDSDTSEVVEKEDKQPESDVLAKTRAELADLDDLDV